MLPDSTWFQNGVALEIDWITKVNGLDWGAPDEGSRKD
jgi:hypothetical protein